MPCLCLIPFNSQVIIRANRAPANEHRGRYNAPSRNNKGVAVVFDDDPAGRRDIILTQTNGALKRIHEFHPSYDALHYPLLYPAGEDGYHIAAPHSNMKHYSFKLMVRKGTARFLKSDGSVHLTCFALNPLHASKMLFQQYIVDMAAKVITERLLWYKTHQKEIRAECYSTLLDHLASGESSSGIGRSVRLPATFVGSPRYMFNRQQDSMAILRRFI